ncbi:hypothetical protein BCR44DRAFT_38031, partial [Catenaria anguillulae PL171]
MWNAIDGRVELIVEMMLNRSEIGERSWTLFVPNASQPPPHSSRESALDECPSRPSYASPLLDQPWRTMD